MNTVITSSTRTLAAGWLVWRLLDRRRGADAARTMHPDIFDTTLAEATLGHAAWVMAFVSFGDPLVPVLAPLSTSALAIGHAWVGVALLTGMTGNARPGREGIAG